MATPEAQTMMSALMKALVDFTEIPDEDKDTKAKWLGDFARSQGPRHEGALKDFVSWDFGFEE